MDKVNLTRLFALYLEGLKSDGTISLPDILVQFIIPICCSVFSFALLLKGAIGLDQLSPRSYLMQLLPSRLFLVLCALWLF